MELVIVYFWLSCAASIVALAVIGVLLFVLTAQWRFDRKVRDLKRRQFRSAQFRAIHRNGERAERARRTV